MYPSMCTGDILMNISRRCGLRSVLPQPLRTPTSASHVLRCSGARGGSGRTADPPRGPANPRGKPPAAVRVCCARFHFADRLQQQRQRAGAGTGPAGRPALGAGGAIGEGGGRVGCSLGAASSERGVSSAPGLRLLSRPRIRSSARRAVVQRSCVGVFPLLLT